MTNQQMIKCLEKFTNDRTNFASQNVSREDIGRIYHDAVKPILNCGEIPEFKSKQDEKTFAGNILALSIYAQDYKVHKWKYESSIYGKTPDFLVNNQQHIEVYSPHNDLAEKIKKKFEKQKTASGNTAYSTGFWFKGKNNLVREQITKELQHNKSREYKNFDVLFLVNTIAADFTEDIIESLGKVRLKSAQHSIIYYHGNRMMYRSDE